MKKITDYVEIISVCAVVLLLSAAFFLLPDKEFSESENRSLAEAPELTYKSLMNGKYTEAIGGYFADQFPMRDLFISVKAYSELAQLKGENNGIIISEDALIPEPSNDVSRLEGNCKALSLFTDECGVPVTAVALPRTADVYRESLPSYYHFDEDKALIDEYNRVMAQTGTAVPDLVTPLSQSDWWYYRTDHHYTTRGAYETYCLLADDLGYKAYAPEFFKVERVSDDFCGTSMRTSGFYMTEPDEIELYRYEGDTDYTVTALERNEMIEIPLYDMSKLEITDKYAVFLGGNHPLVKITSGEERPTLLMVRDSYADSIAPFLALHFDLVMVDLRYYRMPVIDLVRTENISQVLVFQGISEYCESANLSYISKGVGK